MEPQAEEFGVLYCASCGKEIGLLGDHLVFTKTPREVFITHRGECTKKKRKEVETEEDFA
jgi:hypothetical protein